MIQFLLGVASLAIVLFSYLIIIVLCKEFLV